jgi:S-adenosylmethionine-diacylgycerolhomoserine-N-methlytransferase
MIETADMPGQQTHNKKVENYYRFHSRIYDATRWSFLFGRQAILEMLPDLPSQPRIMEIGCGTGRNIERLQYHYPDAHILGVDLSDDMLRVAQKKLGKSQQLHFRQNEYGYQPLDEDPFDLILLSYSLTMIGDHAEDVLDQITQDLKPKGYVAVVDFHTSPFGWFKRWMGMNHVDLSGHMLPLLQKYFYPVDTEISDAYFGLWSYFKFLGKQS